MDYRVSVPCPQCKKEVVTDAANRTVSRNAPLTGYLESSTALLCRNCLGVFRVVTTLSVRTEEAEQAVVDRVLEHEAIEAQFDAQSSYDAARYWLYSSVKPGAVLEHTLACARIHQQGAAKISARARRLMGIK